MKFYQRVISALGNVQVQVEGYFTERVINLCKLQNVKIWNIINITSGIVRFNIAIVDVKKLKPIIKKSKCSLKIIRKKGLYFKAFKYRKRKIIIPLIIVFLIGINVFNRFIWNVEILGNSNITKEYITDKAKLCGIYEGKFKSKIDVNHVIKLLKKELPEVSWIGIEYKGTTAFIKVVEKTTIPKEIIYDRYNFGNIVANKSGILTKVIAENGTVVHKVGSYIESGMTLIEGVMHSEILGDYKVRASGIARMDIEYIFEKEYEYIELKKEYLNKNKYTIGLSFNNNEICLNYLNKSKKYDTLKSSLNFSIFKNNISLDWYKFSEYNEVEVKRDYNELLSIAINEKQEYVNTLLTNESTLVSEKEEINITEKGIIYKNVLIINEEVGIFKGE